MKNLAVVGTAKSFKAFKEMINYSEMKIVHTDRIEKVQGLRFSEFILLYDYRSIKNVYDIIDEIKKRKV